MVGVLTNRPAIWLITLLLVGLPMFAHASEVGHILDPLFSFAKVAVSLLAVLLLLLFLLIKVTTRK